MMRLFDVIKAHKNVPVDDPLAALLASSMGGWAVDTITGIPPIIFDANGKPLTDYLICGETMQDGTPSPDMPVDVVGCGVRTENLLDASNFASVQVTSTAYRYGTSLGVLPQGTYTFNATKSVGAQSIYLTAKLNDAYSQTTISSVPFSFTADGNSEYIIRTANSTGTTWEAEKYSDMMLNIGSTALPYEPYGYKIPITCGGETNNIYLSEPLRKQLNGDAADEINYATQTLTRRVDANCDPLQTPTTESITAPTIPTIRGSNTLSVGTTVQPSSVSITGHIKPTGYGRLTDKNGVYILDKNGVQLTVHGQR